MRTALLAALCVLTFAGSPRIVAATAHGSRLTNRSTQASAIAISPQPIAVTLSNKRLNVSDSIWTVVAGIGTIALALATFTPAAYTRSLANQTRFSLAINESALNLEREARKDAFLPHLALIVGDQATIIKTGGGTTRQCFGRELHLKNVGVGPALNVKYSFMPQNSGLYVAPLRTTYAVGEEEL